jgi:hypothetical protein
VCHGRDAPRLDRPHHVRLRCAYQLFRLVQRIQRPHQVFVGQLSGGRVGAQRRVRSNPLSQSQHAADQG